MNSTPPHLNLQDLIYSKVINLPRRTDRKSECDEELKKINFVQKENIYFAGKDMKGLGAKGCSLSHAMVLSEYLFNSDAPFALIFEDDFSIADPIRFQGYLENAITRSYFWDVFLLAHTHAVAIDGTPLEDTFRCINALTASCYLVKRDYAPKLIECFFKSANLLADFEKLPLPNKEIAHMHACLDMLWKDMQLKDRFWFTIPPQSVQRGSSSDIQRNQIQKAEFS